MNRPFPFFVALRYIFAGKGNRYLSFVSLSSLIGMILGVLSLLVVLAVMNGFRSDLENRVLRLIPHAHINADTVIPD
ncbi:MAG: lipoprotein-releasing system transmembrane subunit LolC, partial [Pseudomonadales bacterium]|nr:lipoprotein-releasing system transmembrane subunit LolC [Pseudomonadales bacterium]